MVKIKKVGRPKLSTRNMIICILRFKRELSLKSIAEMMGTNESNICHILERHHKTYSKSIDINNPHDILKLLKNK